MIPNHRQTRKRNKKITNTLDNTYYIVFIFVFINPKQAFVFFLAA